MAARMVVLMIELTGRMTRRQSRQATGGIDYDSGVREVQTLDEARSFSCSD